MSRLLGLHVGADDPMAELGPYGGEVAQVFLDSPRSWGGPPEDARGRASNAELTFVHAAYLVNVASDDEQTKDRSRARLGREVHAARAYGARGVVVHAGSCENQGYGWHRWDCWMHDFYDNLHWRDGWPLVLVENSAGRGIAQTPAQLAALYAYVDHPQLRLCVDTAHAWSAGYEPFEYVERVVDAVGPEAIALVHANDSAAEFGSGRDVHAPIGRGGIGLDGVLLALEEVPRVPAVLETSEPATLAVLRAALYEEANA